MGVWDLANGLNAAASRKALEKIAKQQQQDNDSARAVAYTNGWRDGWEAGYAAAKMAAKEPDEPKHHASEDP